MRCHPLNDSTSRTVLLSALIWFIILALCPGQRGLDAQVLRHANAAGPPMRPVQVSRKLPQPAKTPVLYLSRVKAQQDLLPYLEILIDREDRYTIQNAAADSLSTRYEANLSYGDADRSLWGRFTLINDLGYDSEWLLQTSQWDSVACFIPGKTGRWEVKLTGQRVPFSEWNVPKSYHLGTLLQIRAPASKAVTVYLHFKNRSAPPAKLDLTIFESAYFAEWDRNMRYVQGIFLGILLVIILHNLYVFISIREKSYLFFVIYLLSACLFWMISQQYAYELFWPNSPYWNSISQIVFFALMVAAFILFTRSFLNTSALYEKYDRAFLVLIGLIMLVTFVRALTGSSLNAWGLLIPLTLVVFVIAFLISIESYRRGYRPALFYTLANIAFVGGGIIFIFSELQIFPIGFITQYGLQIGTALQASLFALGLADQIHFLREKAAQEELEKERVKTEQERRVAEELRRIDKLKDEFLANTSHELRTPLNGIIGITESLLEGAAGKLSRKMRGNLSMIVSSGKRLASLVNDILDFSRLKTHDLRLQKKPVDIRALTDIVIRLNQPLLENKDLMLTNEIPRDIPLVQGDENRLQQILHNLIGNAIKFTEAGSVTVSAVENSGMVDVSIADTGIGIAKEKIHDIFKSFEQVDASNAREYGGTGLGLAITRQLLELHGGTIHVASEVGAGTTFTFTIPIADPEANIGMAAEEIARAVEGEEAELAAGSELNKWDGSFRILVVDDEPVNQQVLANHLSFDNYTISQALNGEEALKILQNGSKIDLVLLDIMMPRMSGYEVSTRIRERYLPSELPIIMLTAKNQVSDLLEGLACGANDYLTKPFSKNELLARIRTHLNLKMINAAYARFVPHEFLRTLGRESIVDVRLGDQVQGDMTVLFSDIRSFTSLSEKMTPKENFDFLNEYLRYVIPPIRNYRGFIDKYIGDAIMAMFPRQPEDAVQAAIDSIRQLRDYNDLRRKRGEVPIQISIGLHTGTLMLGTIGDESRMDGTVISDAVNLASRLEGLTKKFGASIIISEDTRNGLADPAKYQHRFLGKVQVKGKDQAVSIFEIYDAEPERLLELKTQTRDNFELGLKHYFNRQFADAVVAFKKVLDVNPSDRTAVLYLENSAQFVVQGVPTDWQGIETMDSK